MGFKAIFNVTPAFTGLAILMVLIIAAFGFIALVDYACAKTLTKYPGFAEWLWGVLDLPEWEREND